MRCFRKPKIKTFTRCQSGATLLETIVALAILGTIAVVFLSGLVTTSKAAYMTDQRSTAESLAQSQMEGVKNTEYVSEATQYTPSTLPDDKDYLNYSVNITAEPLHNPDDGIQKITVTINYSGDEIFKLESYKVDR